MKEVVSCERMKQLDAYTIEKRGIPSCVLMERAALKTVEEMEKVFHKNNTEEKILCVCGSGNNGGDGIAIARILFLHGYQAEIYVAGNHSSFTHETARQLSIASNYHVPVVNNPQWREYTTIVDAVFGVGLARPVMGKYKELIETMNRMTAWKVAVDIPSGVNGDTGAVMGAAFEADLTVTFGFLRRDCAFIRAEKMPEGRFWPILAFTESLVFLRKREFWKWKIPKRFPEEHQKETSPPSERFLQWQEARECAAPPISAQRQHLPAVREWYVFLPMKVTVFLCRACFRKPLLIVEKERRPIRMPLTGVM